MFDAFWKQFEKIENIISKRYNNRVVFERTMMQIALPILDTPVSPELLPAAENGEIAQQTESLVGPYELHSLFGSAKSDSVKAGRLLFTDMFLDNLDDLHRAGLSGATEVKYENSIKRTTAVANPRQIERVVRGATFPMQLIYEVDDVPTMLQDFTILKEGFQMLQYDYIGGSGSRGYGRIKVKDLYAEVVIGEVDDATMEECQGTGTLNQTEYTLAADQLFRHYILKR